MEKQHIKDRGILKLEPRPRAVTIDTRRILTPQGSVDRAPASPQPSVDRLSVTWAEPSSMTSTVNLFHLPSETTANNEVKFSPAAADASEDEDYSSLSAVLRQRRASIRRSRKGRTRRPSSPFLPDEPRGRRRSSVFTTSSGDTAISMEEGQPGVVTQEQIFENIHLHKEVLGSVKQQPLGMRRKLKIVHQAKGYIKRHEGQLQERLAQSKSTRDIYARFNILIATKWQQLKREAANTSNVLIPWELRIKEIESHFGSVVASYFTFLRWLFWVNLVIGFILMVFVIVPEYLTANPQQDGERKTIMEEDRLNATNLLTLWEFEGILKCSPIFYGYYTNIERAEYRMPLAYFLTGLVVYIYSFVATLRKMAENSRMSKLSEKEDECIFSWKLFTGWDFMIGNAETAHNRIASVILGFKEALLEEAEKKKDLRNWRIITLRAVVNVCVAILLAVSAYAVVTVVSITDDNSKARSWWRENGTTIVVTVISITFPLFFELLGYLEHYHPRKQLRLQLARIMLLNLLNLYSLIFALFSKIEGMSKDLDNLKPILNVNASIIPDNTLNISETLAINIPTTCSEVRIPCAPHRIFVFSLHINNELDQTIVKSTVPSSYFTTRENSMRPENFMLDNTEPSDTVDPNILIAQSLIDITNTELKSTVKEDEFKSTLQKSQVTQSSIDLIVQEQLNKLRQLSALSSDDIEEENDTSSDYDENDYSHYYTTVNDTEQTIHDFQYELTEQTATSDRVTQESDNFSKFTETTASGIYNTTDVLFTEYASSTELSSNGDEDLIQILNASSTDDYELNISKLSSTPSIYDYDLNVSNVNNKPSSSKTEKPINVDTSQQETTTKFAETPDDEILSTFPSLDEVSSDYTTLSDWLTTIKEPSMTEYDSSSSTFHTSMSSFITCPNITFNVTTNCGGINITQVFTIYNCTVIDKICYTTECRLESTGDLTKFNQTNATSTDIVYIDEYNREMYNLTRETKKKLLKLCWETMFGQELVKLTMMDLVFVLLGTLFMDFFRSLFVRHLNRCWCWDLEKHFPEYGDFKIAENILHLINNQGMVWMGMFFSPGLVVLNVFKLVIMMYLRSWAVMTCNVPHEVVFRVSKSNNFYLALLLTMLFLCVLPVGYSIVWVKPSWHCGPFSGYKKIYHILTNKIYKILPTSLNFTLECIASPAIVIPLLVLLILIIYYLTSLTNSLREANNDLKIQLRRERTEERRKMFQLADTRRRGGSSAMDNTPFARWKKALPTLPLSKSIDSDERKPSDDVQDCNKIIKKRGGIFAKIVNIALDRKSDVETVSEIEDKPPSPVIDDETDTDFHETLPREVLKIKDITIGPELERKKIDMKAKFKTRDTSNDNVKLQVVVDVEDEKTEINAVKEKKDTSVENICSQNAQLTEQENFDCVESGPEYRKFCKKQTSESSNQSKQSDSLGSVIPVITISTTESDDEQMKEGTKKNKGQLKKEDIAKQSKIYKNNSELKTLQRQNSVDSINELKSPRDKKPDEGHKFQYSL